ncbi:MAG: glycosyltransferase [Alteraurantiacibacter sp.]
MAVPFLFLSANTPWVYALAQELAKDAPVTAIQLYDWPNYRRIKPRWPEEQSAVRRRRIVMPPGYAGTLERLHRPIMRSLFLSEYRRLRKATGVDPVLVAPYPYLAPWVRFVAGERLVYYNLDDYALYNPPRAQIIRQQEDELVARAGMTACLSAYQVEQLSRRNPAHANRIRHFALGVADDFINPDPQMAPMANTVGYVGNLGDRVDWLLVDTVAAQMPHVTFHFVGFAQGPEDRAAMNEWQRARHDAFARPNVIYEGGVPQADVRLHYWRYAVNWMPYDVQHPFNLAACPTKIMDAIASGRPFISTPTPEVQLSPDYIAIANNADGFAALIRDALKGPPDASERIAYARANTWREKAIEFRRLLDRTAEQATGIAGASHGS